MAKRSGRRSAAQTPAPKAEQIKGSKKNPKGSASSESSAAKIKLSEKTIDVLKNKLNDFKEKYPSKKNVSLGDLKAVYRRGSGAYSKSHRPTITGGKPNSRAAWSFARVNKFLEKAAGKPVKKAYVQDDDLLENGGTIKQDSLLKAVLPEVKRIFNANGLIINDDYSFTDGSNKSYLPYLGYMREGDKIKKVAISYYEQGFEILGEVVIEVEDDKIEIEVEFPNWNIDEEVEFADGGQVYGNGGLIAPNGKPSNLTPEQYNLVRTPEFKAWFGDWENDPANASKVVDENGEPLVVYHGTTKRFNVFEKSKGYSDNWYGLGFYFTDSISDINKNYTDKGYDLKQKIKKLSKSKKLSIQDIKKDLIEGNFLIYCFLSIKKPVYLDEKIGKEKAKRISIIEKDLIGRGFDVDGLSVYLDSKISDLKNKSFWDFENTLRNLSILNESGENVVGEIIRSIYSIIGFDGIIMNPYTIFNIYEKRNMNVDVKTYHYIAFEPNQIKLSDGTNKTFDPSNPDIRYEDGGLIAPNGKPSNLTPEQYNLVRTHEFKAWFGDWENDPENASKVVDENGEPMVVYHGSRSEFTIFDINKSGESSTPAYVGFWFTPIKKFAYNFASTTWYGNSDKINVYPLFLSIKNPKIYNSDTDSDVHYRNPDVRFNYPDSYQKFKIDIWALDGQDADRANVGGIGMMLNNRKETIKKYRELLENEGFDGIFINKTRFDRGEAGGLNDQIVALFPNQIKLADGTNKTFDMNNSDIRFDDGGEIVQCVRCEWTWSTADSDPSDMYVCHKCGFDNSLFYDGGILKPNLTLQEIAEKHNVELEYVIDQLFEGTQHELEHTENTDVAKKIALHHLAETPDYYQKLKTLNLEDGGDIEENIEMPEPEPVEIEAYLMQQRAEAQDVMTCTDSRIFKTMICKTKIEIAEKRMSETDNPEELNVWNECIVIWSDCLNDIVENNIPVREYKDGGKPCGCGQLYAKGGLAYGNSHDKGGIPLKVSSTGQNIEIEGGEGVVNKRSMQMTKKLEFEGKELTPCEVVSKINEMGGGVKFKCADVQEIIAEDGHF